jgi:hypothetical protein
MPSPYVVPEPQNTPYEYIGEPPQLGSLVLTKLARSFAELETSSIKDLFPDQMNPERSIVIETEIEELGIMELVQRGVPNGATLPNTRLLSRTFEPAFFRSNDFIEQYLINQLRAPGTLNEQNPPTRILEERMRRMIARHSRLGDLLRSQVLLGGIDYRDPRTGVRLNVSTQIPAHNFFHYYGFNDNVAANADVTWGGTVYTASRALTDDVGRPEALYFRNSNDEIGVPWTDANADIVRCLRYIKQYLKNTNKNIFTELIMSSDLYTVLLENNFVKAYTGQVGTFTTKTSNRVEPVLGGGSTPFITFGPGGDITAIAGLNIRLVDHLYTDPVDGVVKNMWPSNKVALVAKTHINDSSLPLGYTQHCSGEAEDGKPGLWVRSAGPEQSPPPNLPGRSIQMGDAFLPFAVYPQWISILEVCAEGDIDNKLILRSDLGYMNF